MKTFTDETAPETFLVNCIFSPVKGEQVFEDIEVPLDYGEQAVRAFFEGYAAAKGLTLAKVSMCVYNSASQGFKSPRWYGECSGKLYFNQDKL